MRLPYCQSFFIILSTSIHINKYQNLAQDELDLNVTEVASFDESVTPRPLSFNASTSNRVGAPQKISQRTDRQKR